MWVQPKHYKVMGERLAAARVRADLTQQQLARKLGKPQSFVSDYERGQRRVDILEFLRIVDAIDAEPGALFAEVTKGIIRSRR